MKPPINKLFWKFSATFLLALLVVGIAYLITSSYSARHYFQQANQQLHASLAESTVNEVQPFINGQIDTLAIQEIMESMMVINPSVEVYLLDTEGTIITYVAPYKRVRVDHIELDAVLAFISAEEKPYILGPDPRHPGEEKVFSAAPILENDSLEGYMYIILASEEQAAVTSTLFGGFMMNLGGRLFLITLLGALTIGLVAIWYFTRNLRALAEVVQRFREGNLDARVPPTARQDLPVIGETFNEMADSIVANINELKSVENLRRELIANVSHDLRTPLAIMQGYIETVQIKDDQLTAEERNRYLQIALESSENLNHLVSQLFEFSKLEARQIEPQKEPFFISELAQDVFHKYQILSQDKDIDLQLSIPENLPMVFADLPMVERVIQNLMDNALRYTPSGGTVTIALRELEEQVEIQITDTGIGIPEGEMSFIFERYHQSKPSGESRGAGLGLAIVKKILELHNSSIQVQSRLNEGTAFKFELPAWVAVQP